MLTNVHHYIDNDTKIRTSDDLKCIFMSDRADNYIFMTFDTISAIHRLEHELAKIKKMLLKGDTPA